MSLTIKSNVDQYILLLNAYRAQTNVPELSQQEIEEITTEWQKLKAKQRDANIKFVTSTLIVRGLKLP